MQHPRLPLDTLYVSDDVTVPHCRHFMQSVGIHVYTALHTPNSSCPLLIYMKQRSFYNTEFQCRCHVGITDVTQRALPE